jgi:hypothetical protein
MKNFLSKYFINSIFILTILFIFNTLTFAQLEKNSDPNEYTEGNFYTDGKMIKLTQLL